MQQPGARIEIHTVSMPHLGQRVGAFLRLDQCAAGEQDPRKSSGRNDTARLHATAGQTFDAIGAPSRSRAIESGSLDQDDDLGTEFNFGLERILDGIESLIDRSGERPSGG